MSDNTVKMETLNNTLPLVRFSEIDITKPLLAKMMVCSETASEMLKLNIKNRRIRNTAVDFIKYQIVNGEWRDDHPQPIVFSSAGRLIDGQHRLIAIQEMGLGPFDALMVRVEFGADDTVREYMDTGVPRSLDDRVEVVDDLHQNKLMAQMATMAFSLTRDRGAKKPSPEYFREWFLRHQRAAKFVANHHKRDKGVGRVQVAYAAAEYYERDQEKASVFYPALFVPDSSVQQARMLRDYLLRTMMSKAVRESGGSYVLSVYAKSIGCMKAHLQSKEVRTVRESKWD